MDQQALTGGARAPLQNGALAQLRAGLRGEMLLPGEAGYEAGRHVWNGMIDRHPALIIRAADAADVVRAVAFARDHELPLAVRGGGHNVAGFGTCDDGVVVDLGQMKATEVNVAARTVRVQGGATWADVDAATQTYGLATTGGLVSETGVGGLTLGGGIGWLMRKYGLACDNLLSADIVTADGKEVTASATEHPDLFWGLRGGGGNFGVVTSFKFRLHPVGPTIFGGPLFHPIDQAPELLRFYRGWVKSAPDELNTLLVFLTAPPAPFVPQHLQGTPMVAVVLCYIGEPEKGPELVQPLREFKKPAIDLVGPMPYVALQTLFDASVPNGIHSYWKTAFLRDLDDATIDILLEHAAQLPTLSPFTMMHVHQAGGAISRADRNETAFAQRSAPYILNGIGLWTAEEAPEPHIAWARALHDAIKPVTASGEYINFIADTDADKVRTAYGPATYERLAALKRKYDPTNLFRLNQNIRPDA